MIHPIEAESYRRLAERVDLSAWPLPEREVVARVLHATADLEYASSLRLSPGAVQAGVDALQAGAALVVDVEMVRTGITDADARCYLSEGERPEPGTGAGATRSARGLRLAAARHPVGAVVVVGCAPTALAEAVAMAAGGRLRPALVVGLPVGFVGAAEAKAALRASGLASISNVGDKGGSAAAAAVVNALARLARSGAAGGRTR